MDQKVKSLSRHWAIYSFNQNFDLIFLADNIFVEFLIKKDFQFRGQITISFCAVLWKLFSYITFDLNYLASNE